MKHKKSAVIAACLTAVLSAVLFCLAACGDGGRDLLWYQDTLLSAELSEDGSARVWCITPDEGGFTAVLTAPASVAGARFTVSDSAAYAAVGTAQIPIGERMSRGVRRAATCLALTEEMLAGIKTAPDGSASAVAHFRGADAEYTVAFGADGLPLWIEVRQGGDICRYTVQNIEFPEKSSGESG